MIKTGAQLAAEYLDRRIKNESDPAAKAKLEEIRAKMGEKR